MRIRSTSSGMLVSVCQTVTGACPVILVSAAIMSRSRLRPGRRMTADFMAAASLLGSGDGDGIIFNHGVGEQLLAHGFQLCFGLGLVRAFQFQIEHLALTGRIDAVETEAAERADDGLALRVENAVFQCNGDACLDHSLVPAIFKNE